MPDLTPIIDLIRQLLSQLGISTTATPNFANAFTIFFGGGFMCAAFIMLFFVGILSIKTLLAMRWPATEGVIVAGHIASSHSSEGGTSYRPVIVYQYQVGERTYQNDLLAFGAKNYSGSYGGAQRKIQKYPPGGRVQVYYNPGKPQKSVLEVRATGSTLLLLMSILFMCIGIGGGLMGAMTGM
jgi:hypothetical protein